MTVTAQGLSAQGLAGLGLGSQPGSFSPAFPAPAGTPNQWTRAASTVVPPVAPEVAPALTVAAQLHEMRRSSTRPG